MKPQIYNFHYLDESGIDSLFAQSGKSYIEQIVHKKLNATKGSGKIEFSLGSLFRWLGLGKTDLKGKLSHEKIGSEEFSEIFLVEHKLKIVLDLLKKEKLLVLLTEDNFNPINIQKSHFVELEGTFEVPERKEVSRKTKILDMQLVFPTHFKKLDESLSFELDPFTEFKCWMGGSLIRMGTSLKKYTLGLQHLMIIWHSREVKLRVFGELTSIKEGEFYIKPFSIRAT